jgi:phosphohistidine phosphatase
MNLYLIRHSIAEAMSHNKKDFDRELTKDGKIVIEKASHGWENLIDKFDLIITSPLVRSVQTSEIISSSMKSSPKIIKDNNLASGSTTTDLMEITNSFEANDIACVGHQPDLSYHIINLCGDKSFRLLFPPAAIAKIEFDNKIKYGSGKLSFLIPPQVYR